MQPRTRSSVFARSLVDAATVRPMMNALLEMKRARVRGVVLTAPVAEPVLVPVEVAPLKAA